eukprot:gene38345-51789_t
MSLCALCVRANEASLTGKNYAWKSDNAFIKVSSKDSCKAFTLVEDNLTTEFHLPKHIHKEHTETFYVVSGKVEFKLEDRTEVLVAGDTLHVPRSVPHEVKCIETCKMLTIYEPGGLEDLFEAYLNMTSEEMSDPIKLKEIEDSFDSIKL